MHLQASGACLGNIALARLWTALNPPQSAHCTCVPAKKLMNMHSAFHHGLSLKRNAYYPCSSWKADYCLMCLLFTVVPNTTYPYSRYYTWNGASLLSQMSQV